MFIWGGLIPLFSFYSSVIHSCLILVACLGIENNTGIDMLLIEVRTPRAFSAGKRSLNVSPWFPGSDPPPPTSSAGRHLAKELGKNRPLKELKFWLCGKFAKPMNHYEPFNQRGWTYFHCQTLIWDVSIRVLCCEVFHSFCFHSRCSSDFVDHLRTRTTEWIRVRVAVSCPKTSRSSPKQPIDPSPIFWTIQAVSEDRFLQRRFLPPRGSPALILRCTKPFAFWSPETQRRKVQKDGHQF